MDPILVPAPPSSAYNPQRRVSDLLIGQLKHFQHVETKHGKLGIDPALARDIHTEAGAARYITAITRALRGQSTATPAKLATMPGAAPPAEATKSPAKKAAKKDAKNAVSKKPAKSTAKRKK